MSTISLAEARGLYTNRLQAIYVEKVMPTQFLRSFFTVKESTTKYISIAIKRGFEKIAVDVLRGTNGNRNTFSKSSEKTFLPPYFSEFMDATELDFYDRLWTESGDIDAKTFSQWLNETIESLDELIYKIDRRYELMCAQIFQTGVVEVEVGTNIDFKRKAPSLVAHSAAVDFATGTVNPFKVLEDGCTFIRTVGKSGGYVFNAILGSTAMSNFLTNDIVEKRADIRNITLDSIREPQRIADGVLHGQVTCGAYTVRLWTYPEVYDTASATGLPYIDPKKVIILPENPNFVFTYSGIPQLIGKGTTNEGAGLAGKRGRYHISEHLDSRANSHEIVVESAGLPVPVAVDQIYTVQVVS